MKKTLVLAVIIPLLLTVPEAGADLFNPLVSTDTDLLFIGSVDYRAPLTADTIRLKPATVDPLIPADFITVHWVITAQQGRFDLVPPAAANDIQVSGIHQVPPPLPPHGEGAGNLIGPVEFSQGNLGAGVNTNPGATVVDSMGNVVILSASRLHGNHRDVLQARIDSIAAAVSRITIRADHRTSGNPPPVQPVPEPSSLLLLSSCLAGVVVLARRQAGRCRFLHAGLINKG